MALEWKRAIVSDNTDMIESNLDNMCVKDCKNIESDSKNSEMILIKIRGSYRCSYTGCTKKFSRPSRLEQHMRIHTGEVS